MRILRLDLTAFGPFTGQVLDFQGDEEGLHIIYGPNEAGKSSALRALRQFLYGFHERSSDGFLHPNPKLRIGGVLRRSDGRILECIRRKGRSSTLRGPDDAAVVQEAELARFLGGVDYTLFVSMFGIDHSDLEKGGREILQGGGELGKLLFSAGSGIYDLRRIQEELAGEADQYFKPSASKPRVNEGLKALKETQKALSAAQLSGEEWLRHQRAFDKASKEVAAVREDLEDKQREKHRLERIGEALPYMARRAELLDKLKDCADAVLLPGDFTERRREAVSDLKRAEKDRDQASENLSSVGQALEELDVQEELLEQGELIEQIQQELGSHNKAMKDRTSLATEQKAAERDAEEILRTLRPDLSLEEAEQLRLDKAQSVRIQKLGADYERLITLDESAAAEIDKLAKQTDRLKARLEVLQAPPDTAEARKVLDAIHKEGPLEKTQKEEMEAVCKAEQALKRGIKKQSFWEGGIDELETLPIPFSETIDALEQKLDDARAERDRRTEELEELDRRLVELEGEIEQLRLEQEVPTENDLMEARERRDQGWQIIRAAGLGIEDEDGEGLDRSRAAFIEALPPARDLWEAFELSLQQTDELADRLRREADRVARNAGLLAQRETARRRRLQTETLLETAEAQWQQVRSEWESLWRPLGISPGSPREMRTWAQHQRNLADQAAALRESRSKVLKLQDRIEAYREELSAQLTIVGEPPAGKEETLARLVERAQKALDSADEARSQREQLARELEQKREELTEARRRAQKAREELAGWRARWQSAVEPLGLEAEAGPAEANAVVQEISTLFQKLKEAEGFRQRIRGIDRDALAFGRKVRDLAASVAPDLAERSPEHAASELNVRLSRVQQAKARQDTLNKQKAREENRLKKAGEAIKEINARLMAMCQEAGCRSLEELPAAEERSERRRRLEEQLRQAEDQLRKLSGGTVLEAFIQEASREDPDAIAPAVESLEEAIADLQRRQSELDQTIGSERTELLRMDGGPEAARLAEEIQGILARLAGDAEHYVRLKVASTVLNQAIERYRERNQGPILKRSNELFAHLTLGSFEGLRVEIDSRGDTVVTGVRPGGRETVSVEGMSDGTADQLYLAVRLASLEHYLERNEPIPFVVDDILIKFDDRRAAATLEVLAELSKTTQVIFFTHHRHLLDLAEESLDSGVLFTHL